MNTIGHDCFKIRAEADSDEAEVLIYGDIGESWFGDSVEAGEFVAGLQDVSAKVITARINSYGGSVTDALAIYNALKRHSATVNVEIDGIAASSASLIAQAGDYVGIAANARIMVHAPWAGLAGNAKDMRDMADKLDGWAESMASAYVNDSMTHADALALLTDGKDHWYGADEAVAAGLADNVTDALDVAARYQHNRFTNQAAPVAASTQAAPVAASQTDREPLMADENTATATDTQSNDNVVEIQKAQAAKTRADILARNTHLKVIRATTTSTKVQSYIDEAIADPSAKLEDVLAKIGDIVAEGIEPVGGSPTIEPGMDSRDKFREGVSAALCHRMGVKGASDDRSNEFRGRRLADIAAQSLLLSGQNVHGMTASDIASKVLASHTTSDFPNLLADAANKTLQSAYETFPSTWQTWCARGSVSDFKTVNLIRMGSFNSLETIAEGGEYQAGTVGEEKETLTAVTKGRFIRLSRSMLINDDLQGFSRMSALMGRAAARTVNKDVYTVLNANGVLSDSVALFDAGHANLAGTGGAMTVATLGAGKAAMRKQLDPNANDYLNIMPQTLLVPVALEDTAKVLVGSESDPAKSNSRTINPIRGMAEVVSDPYLDATSATAWYLVASPMDAPLMEVHFLDGNSTPYVDSEEEFLTDAVQWKVRMDYGVAANNYRGATRTLVLNQ